MTNSYQSKSEKFGAGCTQGNTITKLIYESTQKAPDSISLYFGEQKFTYNEINHRSNQLARILKQKGIKANMIVGLMVKRSTEMIIGILAIIKAGGAYLPIDPEYPENRIDYMLKDSGVQILLTQDELFNKVNFDGEILDINNQELYHSDNSNLEIINKTTDLIYVIYTSGSTGVPKGVMIEHKSVCNFIKGVTDVIDFSSDNTILALTTICFDIFVLESLLALAKGLKIVIADENQQRDPKLLSEVIVENKIDMLQITPSRLKILMSSPKSTACLKNLKVIMIGGEQFPQNLLQELKKFTTAKIYNMYGPTETTVWSTIKDLTNEQEVNIGKPISNTRVYIVDSDNRLINEGQEGELCIAGDGLSKGYLNRSDLTSEKFIQNPFEESGKLYKTGDLAKWLPNGDIYVIGRLDQQVKIRGFRIELEEIEKNICGFNGISNCTVVTKNNSFGDKFLVAYYISNETLDEIEIQSYLKEILPNYMIPYYYFKLDDFPMTPNGKVDRNFLSKLQLEQKVPQKDNSLLQNEIENIIVKVWSQILNKEVIGPNDNFLQIGGDSILLAKMILELEKNFNEEIDIGDIFSYPTVPKLSEYIYKKKSIDKSIQLKYLKLPNDFFILNNIDKQRKIFSINIKDELFDSLIKISKNYDINVTDIFISLYLYLLVESSNNTEITFYSIGNDSDKLVSKSISLANITGFEELLKEFKYINNSLSLINDLDIDLLINRTNIIDNSIIPVICFQKNISKEILHYAGIILEIEEKCSVYNISFEYNSLLLNGDKVEELYLKFAKLIKVICLNY